MKLAPLRRRADTLPGVSGVARLDRRTARLSTRLNHGDIAIIDHVDLDRVTAEALVRARPAFVVNAQPSISGRYPNLGPRLVVTSGVPLLDAVGAEVFAAVKEGTRIRIDGDSVYLGEHLVASGILQDEESIEDDMRAARAGLSGQLEAFAVDTAEFLAREKDLLIDGDGIPTIRTVMRRRHVLVVVRGHGIERELKTLRHYIREYRPVLVGVDGGADALLDAGHRPDLVVGDMDAVSDAALSSGAEVVVHALPGGRAPGLLRVQDLGIDALTFPTSGTSEDAALLLADDNDAELIVAAGSHTDLVEFLDRGRSGMASSFLTRLRIGARLVDSRSVPRLHRSRISAAALLLLVIAAFVAIVAALAASDEGRTYLHNLDQVRHHLVNRVQDTFS